jgi:hypothetical protein
MFRTCFQRFTLHEERALGRVATNLHESCGLSPMTSRTTITIGEEVQTEGEKHAEELLTLIRSSN